MGPLYQNGLKDHILGKEELTPQDLIDIQAFKLKIVSNMLRVAFQQMHDAFCDDLEISSLYIIIHKMSILSGILPKWFDCCVNTCITYTLEFETKSSCPLCGKKRFSANGEPRCVFCYLPLILCLQKYFSNMQIVNKLGYQAEYTKGLNIAKPPDHEDKDNEDQDNEDDSNQLEN